MTNRNRYSGRSYLRGLYGRLWIITTFDMTQDWLEQVESLRHPETTVPPGLVPSTQYIYVRESDSKMASVIQIRHCFNEFPE